MAQIDIDDPGSPSFPSTASNVEPTIGCESEIFTGSSLLDACWRATRQGIAGWKLIQTMSRGAGVVGRRLDCLDRFPDAFKTHQEKSPRSGIRQDLRDFFDYMEAISIDKSLYCAKIACQSNSDRNNS